MKMRFGHSALKVFRDIQPRHRAMPGLVLSGGAVFVSLIAHSTRWGAPCLFNWATGLPCASCGMTRGFVALGHGHLQEALRMNLASPAIYAAAWAILLLAAAQVCMNRDLLDATWKRLRKALVPATLALMAAAWSVNLWRHFAGE